MEIKIEKAIRETLVISNAQSVHYAVNKIMKLIKERDEEMLNKVSKNK